MPIEAPPWPESTHRIVPADKHRVPKPFRAFAVRSDEPQHAWDARAPYGCIHLVRSGFLDADALGRLAEASASKIELGAVSDVVHAETNLTELAAAAPGVADLAGGLAEALRSTGVLGADPAAYRSSLDIRIDWLAARGTGFHNDVGRHWSRCLFWLLALDLADVEFAMPHAGVRLPLAPGDLIVFDPAMAHGLCRPGDGGQAIAAHFEGAGHRPQLLLTGELPLSDAQWAALGAPWLPIEEHERRGALDLTVASFDERSGAVQRLSALRDGMTRSVCHVAELKG